MIAEGTLFRAFGDTVSSITAAVEKLFDPEPFRLMLRAIDPQAPIERRAHDIISHLLAFAISTAPFGESAPFTADELTDVVLNGVLAHDERSH